MKILSAAVSALIVSNAVARHIDTFGGIPIPEGDEAHLPLRANHPVEQGNCGVGQRLVLNEIRDIDKCRNTDDLGAAGVPLLRMSGEGNVSYKSSLGDGEMADGYNARTISNKVAKQDPSTPLNSRGASDLIWGWGQFLDHDVDLTEAGGVGEANIPITDPTDPMYGICENNEMAFSRSHYTGTYRQQTNDITACIDASAVYGSDPVRAEALRTLIDGKLKTSDDGKMLPFNWDGLTNAGGTNSTMYAAGDIRANEQVGLLAFHTLFVREHNRLADLIIGRYPCSTDEEIYQMARKLVGATIQIITYNEFLPLLIGDRAPNPDNFSYDSAVDPGIANEFSTAAYRLGHSMLSSDFQLESCTDGNQGTVLLEDMFFKPSFFYESAHKVDWLLKGFSTELAQEIDTQIIDDVRDKLFKDEGGCLDLGCLNIQRGRDHGLLKYNAFRIQVGLDEITDWDQITTNTDLQDKLKEAYHDDINEIDLWIGGLAEDHEAGSMTGETFGYILEEQFTRLIVGDQFFWKWDTSISDTPGLSSIWKAKDVTLAKVIEDNTEGCTDLDDVFVVDDDDRSGGGGVDKGPFEEAKWCCFDSDEKCIDACAFINDCENQLKYGVITDIDKCLEFTLDAMDLEATDTGPDGPFGEATIAEVPALCAANTQFTCEPGGKQGPGSSSGDPHFKTWHGEKYDYHGECDLVLLHDPAFADGLGLRVHIRTTRIKYFSFIEKVAVQIGNETLEFDNDVENFLIDGAKVEGNRRHHKTKLAGYTVRRDARALSIRLHDEGRKHLDKAVKIDLHTRKNGFPAVIVDGAGSEIFRGSLGLLGDWATGKKLARDGKTVIETDGDDATAFAFEWQVRDTEPMLFQEARYPQFPTTCTPPAPRPQRLGGATLQAEAEEACAHWKVDKEDCIFDVLATQDVMVAQEGHIVHLS